MEILTTEEVLRLSPEEQAEYLQLIEQYENIRKYNQLSFFKPYPFQEKFYALGATENVRALIAANRCGKTYSAAMEIAMHLTGKYADWWEGRRWDRPIKAVATSVTFSQVRDVIQKEFLGTENRDLLDMVGTGSIPKSDLNIEISNKARDGAFSEIYVKHVSGGHSSLKFFAYSQGMEPMQGFVADLVYIDEQDKNNFDLIFSELVKRVSTVEGLVISTFTPLQGLTHIVRQFWEPTGDFHGGLVNAGWDDVEHLTEKAKAQMLAATPHHLKDAVTKGIPVLGTGAVFNFAETDVLYDDVTIEDHWEHLCGLDIGFTNDPTAAIFCARDPSTGVIYIYDEYGDRENNVRAPNEHVGPLHAKRCGEIPVIYDSAANAKTGASGSSVADLYREMGVNMLRDSFKNPKTPGQQASSYKSIHVGLTRMIEMMSTGMLKVHAKNCPNWWREFRSYSYDDKGEPSKKDNHWIDASRYAVMTIIQGYGEPLRSSRFDWQDRLSNFEEDDYNYY